MAAIESLNNQEPVFLPEVPLLDRLEDVVRQFTKTAAG